MRLHKLIKRSRSNVRRWPTRSLIRTVPKNSQSSSKKKCKSKVRSQRRNQIQHQLNRWSRSRKETPSPRKTASSLIASSCRKSNKKDNMCKRYKSRQRLFLIHCLLMLQNRRSPNKPKIVCQRA